MNLHTGIKSRDTITTTTTTIITTTTTTTTMVFDRKYYSRPFHVHVRAIIGKRTTLDKCVARFCRVCQQPLADLSSRGDWFAHLPHVCVCGVDNEWRHTWSRDRWRRSYWTRDRNELCLECVWWLLYVCLPATYEIWRIENEMLLCDWPHKGRP